MAHGRQPETDPPRAELDTRYPVWPVASMPRRLQTRPARHPPASSPFPPRFQPFFRDRYITGHSRLFSLTSCARWCGQVSTGGRWRGRKAHPEPSRNPTSVLSFPALREPQAGLLHIRKVDGRSALTKHPLPSSIQAQAVHFRPGPPLPLRPAWSLPPSRAPPLPPSQLLALQHVLKLALSPRDDVGCARPATASPLNRRTSGSPCAVYPVVVRDRRQVAVMR